MRSFRLTVLVLGLVGFVATATAQDDACLDVYLRQVQAQLEAVGDTLTLDEIPRPDNPCRALSVRIETAYADRGFFQSLFRRGVSARDVQIPQGQVGGNLGSGGQEGAAPSIQPVALAGGNVSTVGTDAGTRALATVTINPAGLLVDPTEEKEEASRRGDLGDVTLLVPASETGTADALDYLGLRVRVNHARRMENRIEQVTELATALAEQEADLQRRIQGVLTSTNNVSACTEALLAFPTSEDRGAVESACGGTVELLDPQSYDELAQAIDEVVRDADREYLGLNLSADFGDPTLAGADSLRGTFLSGSVGAGVRFNEAETTFFGVRGRLGARFADLYEVDHTAVAGELGVDVEVQRYFGKQRLQATAGLEGVFSDFDVDPMDEAAQTDFLAFRASVNVPLTNAYSLAVNVAAPLAGDVGNTFNVKLNWNLLWPEAPARGRD